MGYDRSAPDFLEKAAAKHTFDRPAGVVRSKAEQEGGARAMLLEHLDQPGYTIARAAVGVDVDFQSQVQA
jgi:hypothetical protein